MTLKAGSGKKERGMVSEVRWGEVKDKREILTCIFVMSSHLGDSVCAIQCSYLSSRN